MSEQEDAPVPVDRLEGLERVLGMIDQIRSEWGGGDDDDEAGEMLAALGATKAERAYLGVLGAGRWFEALVDIATALAEFRPGTSDFGFEIDRLARAIESQHPDIARRLRERYPYRPRYTIDMPLFDIGWGGADG